MFRMMAIITEIFLMKTALTVVKILTEWMLRVVIIATKKEGTSCIFNESHCIILKRM